jgi:hypothetical protein
MRIARAFGALAIGSTLAATVPASPASAAECIGGIQYCVKTQKFADVLTGADIGLKPILEAKYSNQTGGTVEYTAKAEAGTTVASEASGDLTFGGDIKIAKVEASLGMSVSASAETKIASEVKVTAKPGETYYLQCFGYYSKYEINLYRRVPGPDNNELVGTKYFYPAVQRPSLYCRSVQK